MTGRFWIKFYHEILYDPKMGKLDDHLWRRAAEFFLFAGRTGLDGKLPTPGDMAWVLHDEESEVVADLMTLSQLNITSLGDDGNWYVTHFTERQDSDTPAERKANQRKNEKMLPLSHEPVTKCDTPCHEPVTIPVSELEIESELKLELESDPLPGAANSFFSQVQVITGLMATANDIPVMEKWERDGAIPDDVRAALQWRKDTGKPPIKIVSHLDGSVEMARLKRVQGQNAKPGSNSGKSLEDQGYKYAGT